MMIDLSEVFFLFSSGTDKVPMKSFFQEKTQIRNSQLKSLSNESLILILHLRTWLGEWQLLFQIPTHSTVVGSNEFMLRFSKIYKNPYCAY